MAVLQKNTTGITCVGHGAGMEQRLSPQLTGFAAAQAFHTVTQLVLKLWQHVHRNVLPGTKQG